MLSLILLTTLSASAAERSASVGLLLPYGVQPGVQLALRQPLGDRFFLSPQAAVFVRPGNHVSLLGELEVGWIGPWTGWGLTSAVSVGAGYRLQARIDTETVDLGTGSAPVSRTLGHAFVPTANVELGLDRPRLSPLVRLSLGREVPLGAEGAMLFMVEVGCSFGLGGS